MTKNRKHWWGRCIYLVSIGLLFLPSVSRATLLTFDELARESTGYSVWQDVYPVGPSLVQKDGYIFETCGYFGSCSVDDLQVLGKDNLYQADVGGATLLPGPGMKLSRIDGSGFNLLSLDLAGFNGNPGAAAIFTTEEGQINSPPFDTGVRIYAPSQNLISINLGLTDVTAVYFYRNGWGLGQYDNFVLSQGPLVSPVPEPPSAVLMLTGLLGLIVLTQKVNNLRRSPPTSGTGNFPHIAEQIA